MCEVFLQRQSPKKAGKEKLHFGLFLGLFFCSIITLPTGFTPVGDATAKFTIEAEVVPPAPESTNAWVWIVVGVVALGACAAVVVFIIRKRKGHN